MASYSTNLGIYLFNPGDTNWGTIANENLGDTQAQAGGILEQAVSGYITQTVADSDSNPTTLTVPQGYATPTGSNTARNMYLELTGTLTAARTVILPYNKKLYFIFNNTTGSYSVTVKTLAGTGVLIPNGKRMVVACNGSSIVDGVTYVTGASINSANPSASVGPTAVNGTATTFMTSDSAPAINLTASYTWTGTHTFNGTLAGTALSNYLASPSAIGGTTAAAGTFTTLVAKKAYTPSVSLSTISSVLNIDCTLSNVFYCTTTAGTPFTVVPSNMADGQTINIFITQGGASASTWTASWAKWPGGVSAAVLSVGASVVDLVVATYRGGIWYATLSKAFA